MKLFMYDGRRRKVKGAMRKTGKVKGEHVKVAKVEERRAGKVTGERCRDER